MKYRIFVTPFAALVIPWDQPSLRDDTQMNSESRVCKVICHNQLICRRRSFQTRFRLLVPHGSNLESLFSLSKGLLLGWILFHFYSLDSPGHALLSILSASLRFIYLSHERKWDFYRLPTQSCALSWLVQAARVNMMWAWKQIYWQERSLRSSPTSDPFAELEIKTHFLFTFSTKGKRLER